MVPKVHRVTDQIKMSKISRRNPIFPDKIFPNFHGKFIHRCATVIRPPRVRDTALLLHTFVACWRLVVVVVVIISAAAAAAAASPLRCWTVTVDSFERGCLPVIAQFSFDRSWGIISNLRSSELEQASKQALSGSGLRITTSRSYSAVLALCGWRRYDRTGRLLARATFFPSFELFTFR